MKVFHICKKESASGSRILGQTSIFPRSKVISIRQYQPFSLEVFKAVLQEKELTLIFHQQRSLLLLLVIYILAFVFRRDARFVYDVHDLLEKKPGSRLLLKVSYYVDFLLENLVFRLNITAMTVSRGLERELRGRYGKPAYVVYNINNSEARVTADGKVREKVVYFGQLKKDRLPLSDLKVLSENGYAIDIYGFYPFGVSRDWKANLEEVVKSSGGRIYGEYSVFDMEFLADYQYSLMLYPSKLLNFMYCMPNKLFQSLNYGLTCLVSDNLKEIREEFESSGYVQTLSNLEQGGGCQRKWGELTTKLESMAKTSHVNFMAAISPTSAPKRRQR